MNKKLLIALGCASMLVCGCDKKVEDIDKPIVKEKELYNIVSGNKYDLYEYKSYMTEKEKKNVVADFSYPQINLESEESKELNDKIKNMYNQLENSYSLMGENGCICVKIDNQFHCQEEHLGRLGYELYETESYLTISIINYQETGCAGNIRTREFYIISKEDDEIIDNEEIFEKMGFDKNSFMETINNKLSDFTVSEGTVKYGIYDDNNMIVSIYLDGVDDLYLYDGTNLSGLNS